MNGSLRIARIFGIPIEIHYTWLIVFGLIAWSLAVGYFPRVGPDLGTATIIILAVTATLLFFAALLMQQGIPLETGEFLKLLPHVHGTDGFFAAAMARAP